MELKFCYNVYESTLQPEKFFNHILNNWHYFWCPSEWQRQCTINQGFPADRVMVVPEGVDGEEFSQFLMKLLPMYLLSLLLENMNIENQQRK